MQGSIEPLSRVHAILQQLASYEKQYSQLSPESRKNISRDVDRLADTLTKYIDASTTNSQQGPPEENETRGYPEYQMGMVLRKANAGLFIRDLVNKTVYWSPESYALLGIDPSVPSHTPTFMQMIHPDDYERVERDSQSAIQQGGSFYMEFRVFKPDGQMLWLSSIGYVEHDAEGRPITLTGINQDISARKLAEEAREKAQVEAIKERNRLLAVMDALPMGVAILNREGEILLANQGFEAVWGSPVPATSSVADFSKYKAKWIESQQPIQVEAWAAAQAIQHGRIVTNQALEIACFDGSQKWVLNSAAPFRDEKGEIIGCAVAILDISEYVRSQRALHQSEQSLRISEERLRVTLSHLPISVFMVDRDLRYTWVYNPLFGMNSAQMLGKRDDEIHPSVHPEYMEQLRSVMESGQGFQREIKTDVFGQENYILLSVEPFRDDQGNITGLFGAGMDITAQRQLEISTREAMKQIEVQRQIIENREKERMEIAREIHDGPIQTLVSLLFNLHAARDTLAHSMAQDGLDEIQSGLKSAVQELRDVVNNLRPPALLRIGLGKTLLVYAEDFRGKHPELALEIQLDVTDETLYLPEAASLSIFRLCQEGLNNIARHAQATQAAIRFFIAENDLVVEIHDDGVGFEIPQDLIVQTQAGHFGLAGMYERVSALGGTLRIESGQQEGTTIRVTLPVEKNEKAE